jgi:hypothetical protein
MFVNLLVICETEMFGPVQVQLDRL